MAARGRLGLERGEQPRGDPEPAMRAVDPHPHDLVALEHSAAGRLAVEAREQEHDVVAFMAGASSPDRARSARRARRSSAGCTRAHPPSADPRGCDRDQREREQPAHLGLGPSRRSRCSASSGASADAASSSEMSSSAAQLRAAPRSEGEALGAPVGRVGRRFHEAVALQRAQHAGEVAGVEAEADADVARRRAARADLVQHAALAQRPVAEVAIVQRSDLTRDQAVEGAHARRCPGRRSFSDSGQRIRASVSWRQCGSTT